MRIKKNKYHTSDPVYIVIQEESWVLRAIILSVLLRKNTFIWTFVATEMELFESPDLISWYSYLWGFLKNEVNKRKVDTPDELLARILDAAACIKKSEDQLRRTTDDLPTRVAECVEADGVIFRNIYCAHCNKYVVFM